MVYHDDHDGVIILDMASLRKNIVLNSGLPSGDSTSCHGKTSIIDTTWIQTVHNWGETHELS